MDDIDMVEYWFARQSPSVREGTSTCDSPRLGSAFTFKNNRHGIHSMQQQLPPLPTQDGTVIPSEKSPHFMYTSTNRPEDVSAQSYPTSNSPLQVASTLSEISPNKPDYMSQDLATSSGLIHGLQTRSSQMLARFTCHMSGCTNSYARLYELHRHQRMSHTGIKPWECRLNGLNGCTRGPGNGFGRKDHLRQHMRQVHRVSGPVTQTAHNLSSSTRNDPQRSLSASPPHATHISELPAQTRTVVDGNFMVEKFGKSDYKDGKSGDNEVIRPHEYQYTESDRSHAFKSRTATRKDTDPSILSGIKYLQGDNNEEEMEGWSESSRIEKKLKGRNTNNIQKRTLSQSVGSGTDDEDLEPVKMKGDSRPEFGRKSLREKFEERASLISDDPSPKLHEAGEESRFCEHVTMGGNEEGEGCQAVGRELPYYRGPSSILSAAPDEDCPQSTPCRHRTNETGNFRGDNMHISDPKLTRAPLGSSMTSSQSSSMIDSSFSEDATDWEEDSEIESYLHRVTPCASGHLPQDVESHLPRLNLEPMKRELVDRLMDDFWVHFNQKWPTGTRQYAGAPSNSPSTSKSEATSTNQGGRFSGKRTVERRNGDGDDDQNPDEDSDRDLGGSNKRLKYVQGVQESPGFSCPYRKHNPQKYCVSHWRSCALSPHKTVARVKGHLYRHHLIHQCQRCKGIFKSDEELDSHIETSERCDAIAALPVDGITRKTKALLQCKKKAFQGQTEAERWKQVYQILFLNDVAVPDPYFEPVRDNEESIPPSRDLTSLTNYEDFLRRHLPHFVRSALEAAVSNEIQPIEEHLRGQILDVIEQAQNRAFLTYRAMVDSTPGVEPSSDSGYISNPSRSSSSREEDVNNLTAHSSTAEPDGAIKALDGGSAQFTGTDPIAGFEQTSRMHQNLNFAHINPSESYPQTQGTDLGDPLSFDGDNMSNQSLFPLQPWGLNSEIDPDAFNWDFPLEGDIRYG